MYSSSSEAMFLAWVNTNNNLSGQTQDAKIQTNNGSEQVNSTHGSFTGTLSNGQVSLSFSGYLGYSSIITGTYDGTNLTLSLPTSNGGMGSFSFVPATNDDFNAAVAKLQAQANNDMATVSAISAQATTIATQQQAVTDANNAVSNDLSNIQGDVSSLNQAATFDSVFSSYAKDWQQMQNDYQTEVNASKQGCGDENYNYSSVQYDAGSVKYDLGSIQYDDGSYDYQKQSIDSDYSSVQQNMTALQNDWKTLQQAVASNTSGTPRSNYHQSDIDSAIASANNAIGNADGVVKKAKQERATYDNEAGSLNNQAQAIPGKMGC
jgi:hypothetical protein